MISCGLDVGGTKVAAGLVELPAGRVLARERIATAAARGGAAVLADCVALAARLVAASPAPVAAIGIGLPELVGPSGAVASAASFDLRGTDVAAAFAHLAPAVVEADVRAAAVAEARLGAGRGHRHVLYVSVGTGISHTLVVDGVAYAGAHGNALVLGAPLVEEVAGGPAIARAAGKGSAEEALADPACAPVVARAAEALGLALAALLNATDPDVLVVGGGLGLVASYRAAAERTMRATTFAAATAAIPTVPAALGADAGVIGAALSATTRG